MSDLCRDLPWWGHILVFVAIFFWEFLMGVTKFGSTIQVVFITPIVAMIKWLKGFKDGSSKGL